MSFYSAAGGLLSLAAIPALILLTGLIVRNPFAPAWLHTEAIATAAGLLLTGGICLAATYAISGFETAALPTWAIGILLAGVPAAATFLLCKVFNVSDRLARAEAGHSPFRRLHPAAAAPVAGPEIAKAA